MSYISILIPAFHTEYEFTEDIVLKRLIKENFVKEEFNLDDENYELILISQNPLEYGVRFYNFGLSLKEIENLLSEKQSMNFKIEKSNESIRHLLNKLEDLNLEIRTNNYSKYIDVNSINIFEENFRLKEALMKQLEFSDMFKRNTEITLISIKEEFSNLLMEIKYLKSLKSKENHEKYSSYSNNYMEEMDCTQETIMSINKIKRKNIPNGLNLNPLSFQNPKFLSNVLINK